MAKKFLVPIDLNQLELQNVRMQNLASAPASPVIGQFYYNTTTNKAMVWDGTDWIPWEVGTSVQPATNAPLMDGTAAVGTSLLYAREDHVHPTDTSLVNQNAFGIVSDGTDTHTATSTTDTLTIYGSDGIGVTLNASGHVGIKYTEDMTYYGTSLTAASTQTKVVTTHTGNFVLEEGAIVYVMFGYGQSYNGTPKLDVDGTGAKNIIGDAAGTTQYMWKAGEVVGFAYDGSAYRAFEAGQATTTYYGVTKLSSATNSSSNALAATPSAVKAAYDLANGKSTVSYVQNLANGTQIGTITINGSTTTIYAPTPTGQVQADWTEADSTAASYIQNKPTLATVATSGAYGDLTGKPTLGTAAAKGVDTTITSGSTSTDLPTTAAVVTYVSQEIGAADAMRFKGTIGTGGTITTLPSTHQIGDTYRVITAGTYAGQTCEIGDLIIAMTTSGTTSSDWTVAQTNIDGAITTISGTSPISVSGSGTSRTVSHDNSGATAGSYGDSSAQTPAFGGVFKVPYVTVNATGHVTDISEHNVTIPSTAASTSGAGIVQLNNTVTSTSTSQAATANAVKSAYDRADAAYALAAIPDTITTTTTIAAGQTSGTATAPSSGGTRYKHGSYTARIGNDEIVLDASINESTHVTTYSIASAIASDITIITVWVLN